jgi:hypothetical protein
VIQKQNEQQQKVGIEMSSEKTELGKSTATAQESPGNVNTETAPKILEKSGKEYFEAYARLMASFATWSMEEFSKRK